MKCMKFKQHTLIQLIVLLLAATHALAESYTWNGGNGEWVTESNWTPNGTPGADDTATITSGNIAITGSISIGTLHVSAATITGTGTLTITTGGSISSSTLQGNGGTTVIGSGASVTLGEGETKFKERLLSIEGTLIHEGTSNILLESVLIEIKAGGTLDLRSDTLWKYNGGGAPTIRNAGTLRKSNSTGESSFELWNRKVENSGTIEALSGTLRLTHGVAEGGTFHAATGAQILINRESVLNDVSITGTGLVEFDHGWGGLTLTGNCSSTCASFVTISIAGDHTLSGTWRMTAATLGAGTTTIPNGAKFILEGDSDQNISDRTLDNSGMIIHQGSGNLRMANGVIENRESGLIDIQSDGDWVYGGNNGPIINNAGTLRKSGGSDVTYFNFHWGHLKLNNTGTVESTSGTIDFWQGLQGTGGTVHVGAGAQVLLKGDSNITDASFTGPGIVRAPSGNHTLIGNCYSENFELNGGILMGTHVLSGIWHWSSGAFGLRSPYSDGGTTTFAEDCLLRVITDSDHTIDVRAVTNHGVIHHVGTGSVIIKDFSSFTNEVDGILVLDSVSQWIDPGSNFNKSPFINKGTIYETAASDTTFTFISFEDTGTHIAENAWIEDPNHGWIYMTGFGGSGYFIYDHATQTWAWIPYHHYPNMFLYGEGGFWAWFVEQTQSINRWWFTFGDTPGWLYEGDMLP